MGKVRLELGFEGWEGHGKVRMVQEKSTGIFKEQWVCTGGAQGMSYLKDELRAHSSEDWEQDKDTPLSTPCLIYWNSWPRKEICVLEEIELSLFADQYIQNPIRSTNKLKK